jgi:hypothetical protein
LVPLDLPKKIVIVPIVRVERAGVRERSHISEGRSDHDEWVGAAVSVLAAVGDRRSELIAGIPAEELVEEGECVEAQDRRATRVRAVGVVAGRADEQELVIGAIGVDPNIGERGSE